MAPDREVMDILKFTQHDLEANQQNEITPHQRNRFWKELLDRRIWLYFLPIALGAGIFIALLMDDRDPIKIASVTLIIASILMTGVYLVLILNTIIILSSRVHSVDGAIFLSGIDPANPSTDADRAINAQPYYTINIGEDYFYVVYAVYKVLKPYEREYCTVYYLADPTRRTYPRKEILSIDFDKSKKKQLPAIKAVIH